MPKRVVARRAHSPPHVVLVDTNILWDKNKSYAVSPAFDAFWKDNSSRIPLELLVPEVVLGELKFQQTTSALKALKAVTEHFAILSGIAQHTHSHKISNDLIRKQVCDKIDLWLSETGGRSVSIPVSMIDWRRLVDAAIWREPPFSFDPDDKEKGFRDALILETMFEVCRLNTHVNKNIVFVCNDNLLRETAKKKFGGNSKVLIFESLPDFGAYINLTQNNLTDSFVKEIQAHARTKFFTASDPNCICNKFNIRKLIEDQYAELLPSKVSAGVGSMMLGGAANQTPELEVTKVLWFNGSTQFSELKGQKEFHWVSRIMAARLLTPVPVGALGMGLGMPAPSPLSALFTGLDPAASSGGLLAYANMQAQQSKIQVVNFDVLWKAFVKNDGRFHKIDVSKINYVDTVSDVATNENIKAWHFE